MVGNASNIVGTISAAVQRGSLGSTASTMKVGLFLGVIYCYYMSWQYTKAIHVLCSIHFVVIKEVCSSSILQFIVIYLKQLLKPFGFQCKVDDQIHG